MRNGFMMDGCYKKVLFIFTNRRYHCYLSDFGKYQPVTQGFFVNLLMLSNQSGAHSMNLTIPRLLVVIAWLATFHSTTVLGQDAVQKELERLRKENEKLKEQAARHRKSFIESEKQNARIRRELQSAKFRVKALLTQNLDLRRMLAKLTAKAKENAKRRGVSVKAEITEIDPNDKELVQMNVGSDHGVKMGARFTVYRFEPRALYLGVIEIISVKRQTAKARRIFNRGRGVDPLQVGDRVMGIFRLDELYETIPNIPNQRSFP